MEKTLEVGAPVLIIEPARRYHYHRAPTRGKVARVTAKRVFVREDYRGPIREGDAVTREFSREGLREYGAGRGAWDRAELVIDPEKIRELEAAETERKERDRLESEGRKAFAKIDSVFGGSNGMNGRSEVDIRFFIALAEAIETRESESKAIWARGDLSYNQKKEQDNALDSVPDRVWRHLAERDEKGLAPKSNPS